MAKVPAEVFALLEAYGVPVRDCAAIKLDAGTGVLRAEVAVRDAAGALVRVPGPGRRFLSEWRDFTAAE